MEVTDSSERFRQACHEARARDLDVRFVATMGALHEGHRSLVGTARADGGFVAMSIFVNPLQFGTGEDLAAYPRDLDRDLALAESWTCDLVFTPTEAVMYPEGRPEVTVDPGPVGVRLEGASRPGFFTGVLTVVAKLLNLTGPCRAYFGEKDVQQLHLVRRMVRDLSLTVEVVGCPTVRAPDGLALSSRNAYLQENELRAAVVLVHALGAAARLVNEGETSAPVLKATMARLIGSEPLAKLDYVAIVDQATWEDAETLHGAARALVAARFGRARLIDNLALPWPPGAKRGE